MRGLQPMAYSQRYEWGAEFSSLSDWLLPKALVSDTEYKNHWGRKTSLSGVLAIVMP